MVKRVVLLRQNIACADIVFPATAEGDAMNVMDCFVNPMVAEIKTNPIGVAIVLIVGLGWMAFCTWLELRKPVGTQGKNKN